MKFYNELEQSWRKLKQDYPEVAKAIKESDHIEKLSAYGAWRLYAYNGFLDDGIFRAPMQTEAEKFLEKWGGKKIWKEGMWRHAYYLVTGVMDHNRVYMTDKDGQHGYIVLRVSDNWQLWESPKPKRELKATDLIGWWASNGTISGPIRTCSKTNRVNMNVEWWNMWELGIWSFTKDPFVPLDQWQTLEEICGGES